MFKLHLPLPRPFLVILILLIQSICFAELSEEESGFYRKNGIQPFIDELQDGDYTQGIYLVPHNLTIEPGKVMTLYPGTTILFKKDTKIQVKGKLVCAGTKDSRVIFRKLDNGQYFNPYEPQIETRWDGIYLADSGELEMTFTNITDSKYGISVSRDASIFTLDSVVFVNNKYQNVVIGTDVINVPDNRMFFYNLTSSRPAAVIHTPPETTTVIKTVVLPSTPVQSVEPIPQKGTPTKIKHLRVFCGLSMVTGALVSGGGYLLSRQSYKDYHASTDPINTEKKRKIDQIAQGAVVGGGIAGTLGLTGLIITFFF